MLTVECLQTDYAALSVTTTQAIYRNSCRPLKAGKLPVNMDVNNVLSSKDISYLHTVCIPAYSVLPLPLTPTPASTLTSHTLHSTYTIYLHLPCPYSIPTLPLPYLPSTLPLHLRPPTTYPTYTYRTYLIYLPTPILHTTVNITVCYFATLLAYFNKPRVSNRRRGSLWFVQINATARQLEVLRYGIY